MSTATNGQGLRKRSDVRLKPSGVEWIGEVPAHWNVIPLKRLARMKNGEGISAENVVSEPTEEYSFPVMGSNGLMGYTKDPNTTSQAIIIGRVGACGSIHEIYTPVWVTDNALILTVNKSSFSLKYLAFVLYSRDLNKIADRTAQPLITGTKIGAENVPLPPLAEQRVIADYLDRETGRMDALVAAKERLLKLLAEKRQALITRAVTRGLDPIARLKPSGVEWLGDVPAHWDIWKVAHGFRTIGSGTTPKSSDSHYYDGDIPWVTTSELRECVIDDTTAKITGAAIRDYPTLRIYPQGTLLFAMYGATIGRLGILGVSATVNQACIAFTDPLHFDVRFVYYWFQMRRPVLIAFSVGGGQPNLSQEDLRQVRIPAPALAEQRAIADYLGRETAKLDALAAKARETITLLKERRSAIISAAVTGKIDIEDSA